jgi:DNA-binding PadR family transcriptional regulator
MGPLGSMAKWYALTRAGREQLASREKNWGQVESSRWERLSRAIAQVMDPATEG